MEEDHRCNCAVCGEEIEYAPSNQENGESSSLLQSYLRGISCHFQEEINFGDLKGLVACDGCSAKINSIQRGKERFEGLRQEVSEVEKNLHKKLTDMESVGRKVLRESKEIEKLIKDRIQKEDLGFGQEVVILKKGAEKASVVMKETMRELKGKRSCVKGWTCGLNGGVEAGTSSSSSEVICEVISSVTSLAARNDDFEASEVFQLKTEQEVSDEEDHNDSNGEPVPECVVKVEEEEIRTTRHRVIYGNRKVSKTPFKGLPNKMLQAASNHEWAEYEVIDLENEEAGVSNELSRFQEVSVVGDSTDGCEKGTMTTVKKRTIIEVDRDEAEVLVEQTRKKISLRSASSGSHKKGGVVEESPSGCGGTEYSGHAATPLIPIHVGGASEEESAPEASSIGEEEEQMLVNADECVEHGIEENVTLSEKGKTEPSSCEEVEKSTDINNSESPLSLPCEPNKSDGMNNSMPVEETVTGKTAKPDMGKEKNKTWNNINVKILRQRLQDIPKISSELFHKLVIKLKEVGKLEVLNAGNMENVSGTNSKPALYQIIKNVEVEQRTLDILFQAGVDFNILNNENQNVIFAAVEGNRSVSFINNLITRGVNENQINGKGQNLLFFAAEKGCSLEVFEFLVDKGVYLNGWDTFRNPYGTIFSHIRKSSRGAYQKRLCLLKALVNTLDDLHGQQALEHFIMDGNTKRTAEEFHDLVQFIFSSKDRFGWFATENLHKALSRYEIGEEAFEMLVNAKCNFKKVDKCGRGSLHMAISGGSCPWILKKLVEQGVAVNSPGNENLLHCAVKWKVSLKTLEFLIEEGLDITSLDSDGYTVLETAVKFKRVDANILTSIVTWSFDAGIRYLKKTGASIFHYAAEYGTPAVLDHILKKAVKLDINELDKNGFSMFKWAICGNNKHAIENSKLLIKLGADVNCRDRQGKTVLHHLAVMGNTSTTAALRFCVEELRLDVNATDMRGKTPLLAIIYEKIFHFDYNDIVESEFEKLKILLENGADVNAKPNQHIFVNSSYHHYVKPLKLQAPLHLALHAYIANLTSKNSPLELVKLLLRNEANVNDPTLEGWTAVHLVIGWKKLDLRTLVLLTDLFGDRLDYSAKTHKGQTALHLAAENKNSVSMSFCLEKGLDVNDLDEGGKTPLDYLLPCVGQKKMKVHVLLGSMQLLLDNGATSKTKQKIKEDIEGLWNTDGLNISKFAYLKLLALFN